LLESDVDPKRIWGMIAQHRYKEAGLQHPAGRNQSTKHMIIREHGLTPGHESRDDGDDGGMVSKTFPCRNSYQSCLAVWHYRLGALHSV
jgi:hypothetical protein